MNVHPAKTELRFRDAGSVRSLVIGALTRVLSGAAGTGVPGPGLAARGPLGGGLMGGDLPGGVLPGGGLTAHHPSPRLTWSAPPRRGGIQALPLPGGLPGGLSGGLPEGLQGAVPGFVAPSYGPGVSDSAAPPVHWPDALPFGAGPAARTVAGVAPDRAHPLGAAVAQVLDTYIVAVAADGTLILVDQHAAHERLTHEAIRTRMLDGGVPGQPLLMPAVVDLPRADAARLLARAADLASLGLEIESFGPGAILVRALPAALGAPDPAPLIRDIADELAELDETMALSARLDAVIARMACHGSIRAGRRLGQAEMDALLRQMEATPRAATCSHGRPTFLKLSKAEIETLFGRR